MIKLSSYITSNISFEEMGLVDFCDIYKLEDTIVKNVFNVKSISFFDNNMTLEYDPYQETLNVFSVFDEVEQSIRKTIKDVLIPELEADLAMEDSEDVITQMKNNLSEMKRYIS